MKTAVGAGKRTFPSVEPPTRSELWFHSALSNLFSPRWSDRVPVAPDRLSPDGYYTPMDQIQPILDELELETWEQLVQQKDMQHWELHRAHGLDVPSLAPWVGIEATSSGYKLERNPYYWKVDVAGWDLSVRC